MEVSLQKQFPDEEVLSKRKYPKRYTGPRPIQEQIEALAKMFLVDGAGAKEYAKHLPALPEGAEGWFAILSSEALFPEVEDSAKRYCCTLDLIHGKIADTRRFHKYGMFGNLDPAILRVSARSAKMQERIARVQKGPIWIVAVQLGLLYAGCSVQVACKKFAANEYGMTSVAAGCILLVHPKRISSASQLHMDCAGDQVDRYQEGTFYHAPSMFLSQGKEVYFSSDHFAYASAEYGSASMFGVE